MRLRARSSTAACATGPVRSASWASASPASPTVALFSGCVLWAVLYILSEILLKS